MASHGESAIAAAPLAACKASASQLKVQWRRYGHQDHRSSPKKTDAMRTATPDSASSPATVRKVGNVIRLPYGPRAGSACDARPPHTVRDHHLPHSGRMSRGLETIVQLPTS